MASLVIEFHVKLSSGCHVDITIEYQIDILMVGLKSNSEIIENVRFSTYLFTYLLAVENLSFAQLFSQFADTIGLKFLDTIRSHIYIAPARPLMIIYGKSNLQTARTVFEYICF